MVFYRIYYVTVCVPFPTTMLKMLYEIKVTEVVFQGHNAT